MKVHRPFARAPVLVAGILSFGALAGGVYWIQSHRPNAIPTIALIPQSAGAMRWEIARFGATAAADKLKCHLYWNAPTSEADAAGQISLIDKVVHGKYQGLVLAPNHSQAVLAPLRRALTAGLPVVVVSASIDLPPTNKLGYIVNDDEKMGELAAAEIARLIHGEGTIALVGLARFAPGVVRRVRAAERYLAMQFPDIQVVSRLSGPYDTSHAEGLTAGALDAHPGLKAILSFTVTATRGAHAALKSRALQAAIPLVGCEQDTDLIGYVQSGELAALVAENTHRMGYEAIGLIAASWAGRPMPPRSVVPPMVITKVNVDSAEASVFARLPR